MIIILCPILPSSLQADAGALSTVQLSSADIILGYQVDEGAVSHSWSLQNG